MLLYPIFLTLGAFFPRESVGKTSFEDCGSATKKIRVEGGSVKPDPILYPGNVSMSSHVEVLEDLPTSGLMMHLKLTKIDPVVMPVPCLKNIGSCSYDVCKMIENNKDQFCPMFPPKEKCGCPLKKSSYDLKDAVVQIPNYGEIFAKILQGHYSGTITFEDSNTKTEVGCIKVTFEIEPSKQHTLVIE